MNSKKSDWPIPASLIVLSLVPVMLHIPAATLYRILGAFQFSLSFRRRTGGIAQWGASYFPARRSWP